MISRMLNKTAYRRPLGISLSLRFCSVEVAGAKTSTQPLRDGRDTRPTNAFLFSRHPPIEEDRVTLTSLPKSDDSAVMAALSNTVASFFLWSQRSCKSKRANVSEISMRHKAVGDARNMQSKHRVEVPWIIRNPHHRRNESECAYCGPHDGIKPAHTLGTCVLYNAYVANPRAVRVPKTEAGFKVGMTYAEYSSRTRVLEQGSESAQLNADPGSANMPEISVHRNDVGDARNLRSENPVELPWIIRNPHHRRNRSECAYCGPPDSIKPAHTLRTCVLYQAYTANPHAVRVPRTEAGFMDGMTYAEFSSRTRVLEQASESAQLNADLGSTNMPEISMRRNDVGDARQSEHPVAVPWIIRNPDRRRNESECAYCGPPDGIKPAHTLETCSLYNAYTALNARPVRIPTTEAGFSCGMTYREYRKQDRARNRPS